MLWKIFLQLLNFRLSGDTELIGMAVVLQNRSYLSRGFTLIEIVMVLVLLGILSAVAVPKYFDLQEAAVQKAAQQALQAIQAETNARFAEALLNGQSCQQFVDSLGQNGSGDKIPEFMQTFVNDFNANSTSFKIGIDNRDDGFHLFKGQDANKIGGTYSTNADRVSIIQTPHC